MQRPQGIEPVTVVPEDDPYLRQRQLCRRRPLRAINAALVRAMGTDLVSVRVDLAASRTAFSSSRSRVG